MQWFTVMTPEYDYKEVILDDGSSPIYRARDSTIVRATDEESARFLGILQLEYEGSRWVREAKAEGEVHIADFTVESLGPNCANCECAEGQHEPKDSDSEQFVAGPCPEHDFCKEFVAA